LLEDKNERFDRYIRARKPVLWIGESYIGDNDKVKGCIYRRNAFLP